MTMTKRIGEFLVERKVLTPLDVEKILEYGKRENLRFGEAGLQLGLLREDALVRVFGKNYRVDFFHLDGRFFPRKTSRLIDIDTIIRYGVLPLGHKTTGLFGMKKTLNLGLLDPGRTDALAAAEKAARANEDSSKTRVFLVLADQFLEVLQTVYGVSLDQIAARPASEIDPTLAMFIGGKN